MTLDVNKEEMSIMGVSFDTSTEFKGAWYALSSNVIEGYEPSVDDFENLKNYIISRKGVAGRA